MVNYADGKVYKIVCNITGKVYIGSTTLKLCVRMSKHKSDYKRYLNLGKGGNLTSFEVLKENNFNIVLIKETPCENKEQLLREEREQIELHACVNKVVPLRTVKQYKEVNKEHIKTKNQEWREANKNAVTEYEKAYREQNKEIIKERKKDYRKRNVEKIKEYDKERNKTYFAKNKERINENNRAYYEKNKDAINEKRRIKH